ncbi:D-arabinono-1,4-lactone oxidase [Pseudonocardia acaciae]|uniref:D-arabinono-1,4-lactone oxidase n=1 Tax=Pseudonocardia acaciae TaxID=551276 RepID=UPI000490D2AE|nr:D-arabinono-1,4-lactone oxidase [Pseudonocardia acaciae]
MTTTWRNWAGNQRATPAEVRTPSDATQLADLVRTAGQRVKPIGSGHSFSGIGITDGIQVDLRRMTGLQAVDTDRGLVTVQSGTPLRQLNELLDAGGLAMSNLGDIDSQTLAGAISTGTHGTGAAFGALATQVRGLELVTAGGSVLRISAQSKPELFQAARVGLGALGVITSVTLAVEPAFTLHAQEGPMPLDQVLTDLDELAHTNEHFEFYWFPHTDRTLTKRNNRAEPGRPLGRLRRLVDDELLSNGAFWLTCRLGKAAPRLVPAINDLTGRALSAREYTDRSYRVFCSPRRVRFMEMEYAVPRAAVGDAIAGIRRVTELTGMRVTFPVEVRFGAADDIPLSMASGRDSAYLAVHMAAGQPYRRYFDEVEAVMSTLDGRPHWGKMHGLGADELRGRYPAFDEFRAVRQRLDPDGVFANEYLDRVLGPA